MKAKLKKLEHQVIVITGASSGIGLAIALTATKRGAKVVLVLDAAEKPTRAKTVGTMAFINTAVPKVLTSFADKMSAKRVEQQQCDEPLRNPEDALYRPS